MGFRGPRVQIPPSRLDLAPPLARLVIAGLIVSTPPETQKRSNCRLEADYLCREERLSDGGDPRNPFCDHSRRFAKDLAGTGSVPFRVRRSGECPSLATCSRRTRPRT